MKICTIYKRASIEKKSKIVNKKRSEFAKKQTPAKMTPYTVQISMWHAFTGDCGTQASS